MLDVWIFLYLCVSSHGQMFAGDDGSWELKTGPTAPHEPFALGLLLDHLV